LSQFHFEPRSYLEQVRSEVPLYDRLQEAVAQATTGREVRRFLDLGVGSGETSRAVLAVHPHARLVGLDVSAEMLAAAAQSLPAGNLETLVEGDLDGPLPPGPFDLVVSALAVHHLPAHAKRRLFMRLTRSLAPGGRFVLGDIVIPEPPDKTAAPQDPEYDHPESPADLVDWLREAGLAPTVVWLEQDLLVAVGDLTATRSSRAGTPPR
jgi:tRNA (cmo5U34)-methyltransferase